MALSDSQGYGPQQSYRLLGDYVSVQTKIFYTAKCYLSDFLHVKGFCHTAYASVDTKLFFSIVMLKLDFSRCVH